MRKASRKTERTKKRAVEIRYEPEPGVEARLEGGFVAVDGLECAFADTMEKSFYFRKSELGKVLNALTQLEKALYYDKLINEAGKHEIHK